MVTLVEFPPAKSVSDIVQVPAAGELVLTLVVNAVALVAVVVAIVAQFAASVAVIALLYGLFVQPTSVAVKVADEPVPVVA